MERRFLYPLAAALLMGSLSAQEHETNLVPNPGFEAGAGDEPTSWKFASWNEASGEWTDEFSSGGSRSVSIAGLNGGWAAEVPVQRGAIHHFAFRYRSTGGPSKLVAYVRDLKATSAKEKVLLYDSTPTIESNETSKFVAGAYVVGADESRWVDYDGGSFSVSETTGTANILIKLVSDSPDAKLWIDEVRVVPQPADELPETARVLAQTPGARIWWEDENRKVFPSQDPPEGHATNRVDLDLARGEYGSVQIIVTPEEAWTDVDWTWSENSAAEIQCRLVETIPITDRQGPLGRIGPTPDPLTEKLPTAIERDSNRSFWFTVRIPDKHPSGVFEEGIILTQADEEVCRIPLHLRVREFSLPQQPSIDILSGFRSGIVRRIETGDTETTMKRYYRSFFEHRTRCAPAARPIAKIVDGEVSLEMEKYIEHLRFFRDEFGPRPFFLPVLWIAHEEHKIPPDAVWNGQRIFTDESFTTLTPTFTEAFREAIKSLVVRLEFENLFADPVIRFIDEPDLSHPATVSGIRAIATLIHEVASDITISLTAAKIHPDLVEVVGQWVLHTDGWNRSLEEIAAAREAGCRIYVYNNAMDLVDYEPIRTRLWPWFLKKYEIDGSYSWWGTTCWTGKMEDPWTAGEGSSGVLLYPPRTPIETGPIESVRWELLRQGLQDFEYLHLADKLATRLESEGQAEAARIGRNAVNEALSLVGTWPQVRPASNQPYERDVTKLQAARTSLADAIEKMQQADTEAP